MLKDISSNYQEKSREVMVYLLLAIAFFVPLLPLLGLAILVIAIGTAIYRMIKKNRFEIKKSPAQWAILGFVICSGLSVINSPIPMFSLGNWIYGVGSYMSVYYLTLTYINDYESRKKLLLTMIASAVCSCVYGLFQYSQMSSIAAQDWVDPSQFPLLTRRLYSTLQNPNLMATYLLEILAIAGPLAILSKSVRKPWQAWCVALFLILCVVLTYSRGVWISLVIMVLYWGLVVNRKLLISLLAIPGVLFFYHGGVAQRLWSMFGHQDTSVSLRYALWDSTTYMISEHPFLGIGWGSYWKVYPNYNYFIQDPSVIIYHAHNMYLHMAAAIGIPGFLFFMSILLIHAWKAFKLPRLYLVSERVIKYGITALIIGICVSGMTDYELFSNQVSIVFWQILALGAGVINEEKSNENKARR